MGENDSESQSAVAFVNARALVGSAGHLQYGAPPKQNVARVFYGNETFYMFFRLHHLLCKCLERAVAMSAERRQGTIAHTRFLGVVANLLRSTSAPGHGSEDAKAEFEAQARVLLGANSYVLSNIDTVVGRVVRQLHLLAGSVGSSLCERLLELHALHVSRVKAASIRGNATPLLLDSMYRESVSRVLEASDTCYRFEWSEADNRRPQGTLTIRTVSRGSEGNLRCPGAQIDATTAYARRLVASVSTSGDQRRPFLKRNLTESPSRSARLAQMVQVNGLEMTMSVHCADSDDESDEGHAAAQTQHRVLSGSKRRRTGNPASSYVRPVVYVADTEDLLFKRRR